MTLDTQAAWVPTNNFFSGRNSMQPRYIINHGTAGGTTAMGIANYFKSTEGSANPVSSNYIIGTDGVIIGCVAEENGSFANGFLSTGHDVWWQQNVNPNWITVTIEHVKSSLDNTDQLTDAQKLASFGLIQRICQRWNIPMRAADAAGGITGHYSIDPVNRARCPGAYPWADLWAYLGGGDILLSLSDPIVSRYFTDGGNGTWKCSNGVTLLGGNLTFYRTYGGPAVLGLPLTNELQLAQYPSVRIVPCERALIVYDPQRQIDNPPITGPCYLLHINQGIGQQMVAKPLIEPLNTLVQQLQAQLKQATDPTIQARMAQIYALSTQINNLSKAG